LVESPSNRTFPTMRSTRVALRLALVVLVSLGALTGGAVVVAMLDEVVELANEFAPEHMCLHVRDAETVAARIRNAGCVFVGGDSVESIGDYTAGPSHVMPTGGSATFSSPLGVPDFLKVTSVVRLSQRDIDEIGPPAAAIARAEGLTGHARSIEARLREG